MSHLLAFLAVAVLVIITPGPDTALTVRNTVVGGRRTGILTAVGVCAGQAIWVLATSVGLTALLVASEPAFLAVKAIGAAYLVVLGVRAIIAVIRNRGHDATTVGTGRATPARGLRQGLINDLGNPKMAAFFTGLLPQFAGGGSFVTLLAFGLLFSLLTLIWLVIYATVLASAGSLLRRPRVRRVLDAVSGAVLVGLGLRLAAESR